MKHDKADIAGLSAEFSKLIREEMTADQLNEIIELNHRYQGEFCATHEFCDSNMVMLQAWKNYFEKELYFYVSNQDDTDLWNAAWSLSMKSDFKN